MVKKVLFRVHNNIFFVKSKVKFLNHKLCILNVEQLQTNKKMYFIIVKNNDEVLLLIFQAVNNIIIKILF